MWRITILSLFLLACDASAASRAFECNEQGNSSVKPDSKAAAALSDAVQKNYASISSLQAHFEQDSYLAALDTSEASSGSVWFKKPGLMRWNYETPEKQVFLIREHTVWYYQDLEKQLLIDDLGEMLLSDLPVSFLFGIGNLSRDFEALKVCRSASGRVLTLRPRNATSNELKEFDLLIDRDAALPRGARVIDSSGNVTAIELRNVETDQSIEAAVFEANFPKGIDISDKRPAAGEL